MRFLVAALFPIRYVAWFAVASSISSGLRALPLYTIPPVYSQLVSEFESHGRAAGVRAVANLQAIWVGTLSGYGLIACGAAWPAVFAWVGPGFGAAGWIACILTVGNVVQLCTAVGTSGARAARRPGLEVQYLWLSL